MVTKKEDKIFTKDCINAFKRWDFIEKTEKPSKTKGYYIDIIFKYKGNISQVYSLTQLQYYEYRKEQDKIMGLKNKK